MKRSHMNLVVVAVAVWLVSGLPLWVGWVSTPKNEVYVARVPIVAADTTAYYSNIEQARQGRLLFDNQFTSETQQPSMFHPLWLVTGWVGWLTHLSTPWAFQMMRLIAIWLFLLLVWRITADLFESFQHRWLAILVLLTSSGIGWLSGMDFRKGVSLDTTPVDLWVAESNTFLSIGHSALFIGSQTLVLYLIWSYGRWLTGETPKSMRWTGPAVLLLALIHPYDLLTVGAVWLGWTVWYTLRQDHVKRIWGEVIKIFATWFAWVLPVVAYYVFIVLRQPAMAGWLQQNVDWSSAPYLVLLAYGLLAPLAAIAAVNVKTRRQWLISLLVLWIVVDWLLMYTPGLRVQRRLISGLHIPFALLGTLGILYLRRYLMSPWPWRSFVAGIILVMSLSNIRAVSVDTAQVQPNFHPDYPVRITVDEAAGMDWLRKHTTFSDVIFSDVWMGNTITGRAGRTVVQGHGHQTIALQLRIRDWLVFRSNVLSQSERAAILKRLHVTYLFWRTNDALSGGYQPADDPRWELVYTHGTTSVYRLRRE